MSEILNKRFPYLNMRAFYIKFCIGIIFFISSLEKFKNLTAFRSALNHYPLIPSDLVDIAVIAVPLIELSIALGLLIGRGAKYLLIASSGLFSLFIVFHWSSWRSGDIENCGCFGAGLNVSHPVSIIMDLLFLVLCVYGVWISLLYAGESDKMELAIRRSNPIMALTFGLLLLYAGFTFEPVWSQSVGILPIDPTTQADAVFFYMNSCIYCQQASSVVQEFERLHPRIHIAWIESQDKNASQIRDRFNRLFDIDFKLHDTVPAFFGGSGVLIKNRFDLSHLQRVTLRSLSERMDSDEKS